ncbi:hypothetical protein IFM47457_01356 [Aspergillus lentulus]|nr:hypothetical protein IFM47457_01356 [Aspergillus lentulus]
MGVCTVAHEAQNSRPKDVNKHMPLTSLNTAGGEPIWNNSSSCSDNHEIWGTSAGGCIIGRDYRKQRKFRGPAE